MNIDDRSYLAQALFRFLDRTGVAYCVVGDTRRFPFDIPGDVDIVVEQEALKAVPRMIARFAREQAVELVQMIRHEQTALYFVLAWTHAGGGLRFLAPDVCGDYFRNGRMLLTAEEILAGRRTGTDAGGRAQEFQVPSPPLQFVYYLVKKIDKGELNDGHGEFLSSCWRSDPGGALIQLRRFWPVALDTDLIARAAQNNEWFVVRGVLPRLRASLHRAVPRSVRAAAGELGRVVRRLLRPTGMTVAVLGPDGCGKSSVIERARRDLAPVFRATVRLHFRPRLIGSGSSVPAASNPHGLPARGAVASTLKLVWLLLDCIVGHLVKVRPLNARSTLVLYDRYLHDLLVDPLRFRCGGPRVLGRAAARCAPRPDLWLVLDAPMEVLQARKAEVTPDESDRQRRAYRRLAGRLRNSVVIDASQGLEHVAVDAELYILRHLALRLESRYPEMCETRNPVSARVLLFFCRHKVPVLSKLVRIVFNSDIYCRPEAPVLMPHPYGIVIHSRTVIGRGVTVMHQVTLGGKDPGQNVAPVIEDEVYIGAGAKVLGAVRVGRGALVGANAVVTRDVPPFATVVGANRLLRGVSAEGSVGPRAGEMQVYECKEQRLSA